MRMLCRNCGWMGPEDQILKAPNPWNQDDEICGCPQCFVVEDLRVACYRVGCKNEASMGIPTPTGYILCCYLHKSEMSEHERTIKLGL